MRNLGIILTVLIFVSILVLTFGENADKWERDRVVKLYGNNGQCTGVEVKAPSGKVYTLTAKHCRAVSSTNLITAMTEDGKTHILRVIKLDPLSDLMLLEKIDGKNVKSVKVAKKYKTHDKVHAMTHGKGFPSYRSAGELLEDRDVWVPSDMIVKPEDKSRCLAEGGRVTPMMFFSTCDMPFHVMFTTSHVAHGSSGGPMFNEDSELVGIVSLADPEGFSAIVKLSDVQRFLADK